MLENVYDDGLYND